jgi:hypothetical protein
MIKSTSRRAAILLSGSALALAGTMLPAQAATTGWRISATYAVPASSTILTSVDAVSSGDAWAVGFTAKNATTAPPATVIRHWTGKSWISVTLPARVARAWARQSALFSVVGASPRDVWIFGSLAGGYLRLNGRQWSTGTLPGSNAAAGAFVQVNVTRVFSATNVWVFGGKITGAQGTTSPYAAHYNGHTWTAQIVPGTSAITAASAVSSSNIWALEGSAGPLSFGSASPAQPLVVRWTPKSGWHQPASQPTLGAGGTLSSITTEPGGAVIAGGSASNTAMGTTPLAADWAGGKWIVASLPVSATAAKWELGVLSPDGSGGAWAFAEATNRNTEQLWHLHGGTWSRVAPGFGTRPWLLLALALVPGTHSVWAVGAIQHAGTAAGLIAIDGPTPR